jgi:hypothetical protein
VLTENLSNLNNNTDSSIREQRYLNIQNFLGLPFNKDQLWTLNFCHNPLIKFETTGIKIDGDTYKGQLRESLLAYMHLFFSNDALLKKCIPDLSFIKNHTFNGIIEGKKTGYTKDYKKISSAWCYIAKNSDIYSVDSKNKEDYLLNPSQFPKEIKEDTCLEKLNKYFHPGSVILRYASLNNSLSIKNTNEKKRIKI